MNLIMIHNGQQCWFPEFLPATTIVFFQPAAPSGWEQLALNDPNGLGFMLRIVTGQGGDTGGYMDPTFNNTLIIHNHVATASISDPGHQHYAPEANNGRISGSSEFGGGDAALGQGVYTDVDQTGMTFEMSIAATGNGSGLGWTPQYVDGIICQKTVSGYNQEVLTQNIRVFDSGTVSVFCQADAPVGWTQNTSLQDPNGYGFMMRITNGGGGSAFGQSGSSNPLLCDILMSHNHELTYSLNDPGHLHYSANANDGHISGTDEIGGGDAALGQGVMTNMSTTGVTISISVEAAGSGNGWTPQYTDCIICTKD